MYELTFAILLAGGARPVTSGERIELHGRGHVYAARKADGVGREPAAGAHKSGVRRSEAIDGVRPTSPAGRRSRKESKPPGGPRPRRRAQAPAAVVFPSGESLTVVRGRDRRGQEHFDPTGSGNPLLDTSGERRFRKLSDNFSAGEMARSGGKTFDVARIDPRHVACLQAIRDRVGKPVRVRSGYRSFWYNDEVYRRLGKKPTKSQHISGRASDIWIQGMTGLEVAKVAIDACGPDLALGLGLEYAHVDVRGHPGVWGYEGVPGRQTAELERYRVARRVALRGGANKRRRVSLAKRM